MPKGSNSTKISLTAPPELRAVSRSDSALAPSSRLKTLLAATALFAGTRMTKASPPPFAKKSRAEYERLLVWLRRAGAGAIAMALLGVIMLGLNAARYLYKIRMSGFTTLLGIVSLLGGIAELLGVTSLEGGLLLIILGAYLILRPWFEKRRLFGKAEAG